MCNLQHGCFHDADARVAHCWLTHATQDSPVHRRTSGTTAGPHADRTETVVVADREKWGMWGALSMYPLSEAQI